MVGDGKAIGDNAVSVVIPAYNAESTLRPCLRALHDQSLPRGNYEIIVVDDGSTDRTSEIAQEFNVTYIFQTNQGPATARNKGVKKAQGSIVLFTDSDCVPDHNWIREMVNPFHDPDVVGVKGAYKTMQTEFAARFAQAEFEDRYDLLRKYPLIDMIDTYSAAFRKDVFLRMGGFDEAFPVANNEDTDLSYRLAAEGYKLVFNPKAFVHHHHPKTLIDYLRIKFWRGYWRMIVYRRYPDKAVRDSYTPVVIKIQAILMMLSLPLFFLSLFALYFLYVALVLWVAIVLSSLTFAIKTFRKDRIVGIASPFVVLLRSFVFAIGSILGIIRCFFKLA
jgi:glycosyltransferase involved in cell wall biosynthesis